MLLETTTYLGPARVTEVAVPHLRLMLADREVVATLALSSPYHPAAGDMVLTIGQEDQYYVIGVIVGSGKSVFTAPGDLEFRAPRGKIAFFSSHEVDVAAPRVTLRAGKLELLAKSVMERFGEACRWIKETFQLRAGRVREVVEGSYSVKAERIVERATKDVKIDGEKINLG